MPGPPYTGKCLCGAINFTIASEPLAVLSCFCQHCSKGAGSTNQLIAKFACKEVNISSGQDHISIYTLTDTSSGLSKEKAFCTTCGVPLWTIPASAKDAHLLVRTSVLSSHCLKPTSEIFTKYRPPWMSALEGVTQYEEARKG
ncbi:hypothetical protein CONLIGDRAFT_318586 [Coniochaeta ligniaria NRRL 30616]|uniref:CENP-V/GFA domain-containing protein n=1 Tax=Coniochaeta ligniaria NRRL 30616 TaxID=1408157 RepID=A0A1J7IUV6_9PEZI|nr:hypothetical protein CONLIGDRAFT_318586 [Coniochaeta ligniaria NRRL 30616]